MLALDRCPALVLNADFRPLSYYPLSLWPWQEAVKAVAAERVNVISHYDRVIRSPSCQMSLPSVISLKDYVPANRRPAFTRFNLFLRDRFTCQYCGQTHPTHELTFDHVIPRAAGGTTCWENIVTACGPCNLRKGHKMPDEIGMIPLTPPRQPSNYALMEYGRGFPPNYLHASWRDFLYWDSELEVV